MIREWVKRKLLSRGMVLSRPPGQFDIFAHKLACAKRRGLELRFAVDGGAAVGGWTRDFRSVYPNAGVLCIEPRDDAQAELRRMQEELGAIHVAQVLLGAADGQTEYFDHGFQSSALPNSRGQAFGTPRTAPVASLDSLVQSLKLPSPDLIKLDLQGFEMEALRGATRCLEHAQSLLVEMAFFQLQQGAPLAAELIGWLDAHDFQVYDIPALWHRPLDGALVQGDFLFLRKGHQLLSDNRWASDAEFS